jgi:hypothetical protein
MNTDARAAVLAALREVFDGSWTRYVGSDGGQELHWEGRVGLIAGCTEALDSHHSVNAIMGDRYIVCRMPDTEGDAQAERALSNMGREHIMRAELRESVEAVVTNLDPGWHPTDLAGPEQARIIDLANLAVRCRSSVNRESYTHDIDLVPRPEAPGRLAGVFRRIHGGLEQIGADRDKTWAVLRQLALDSMPAIRKTALELLIERQAEMTTAQIAGAIRYPTTTTRRALEDLAAFEVLDRRVGGTGEADQWAVTDWTWARWPSLDPPSVPQKPEPLIHTQH